MNIFKKSKRCGSPSFGLPKLCLPRQKKNVSAEDLTCKTLDVPFERGRSSSFDSSSLHSDQGILLEVPKTGRRCLSFDSSTAPVSSPWSASSEESCVSDKEETSGTRRSYSLKWPKYRRPSVEIPKLCIHCLHMEAISNEKKEKENKKEENGKTSFYIVTNDEDVPFSSSTSYSSSEESLSDSFSWSDFSDDSDDDDDGNESDCEEDEEVNEKNGKHEFSQKESQKSPTNSNVSFEKTDLSKSSPKGDSMYTNAVTLAVPVIKQHRSSSLDASMLQSSQVPTLVVPTTSSGQRSLVQRQQSFEEDASDVQKQIRSSSVDVTLPTEEEIHYKAITNSTGSSKAISKSAFSHTNYLHPSHAEHGFRKRELRSTVDWSDQAINSEHLWVETNASGDYCYAMEQDCLKTGPRKKCIACKIVAHSGCIPILEKKNLKCKPTFREAGVRNYREDMGNPNFLQTSMRHHWVHRRRQEGKCKQCGKSFQQRFAFQSKEIIAISCSWCKAAYHNKVSCFMMQQIEEQCTLGAHQALIVPPSWIIKLPKKGSFKSSLRRKRRSSVKKKKNKDEHRPFIIKPIPSPLLKPLLVFINPKSGGNQGAKLIHKFSWLLNPRQVFDLTQGGPKPGTSKKYISSLGSQFICSYKKNV
ncbi:hypothetical protein KUTeg_007634 [Tegillarca granosa]|uniref:DAGKc domain-containing protein n=1 Tax=Tegillarca granosa TaxID=220873 RepID=A0ABQ9FDV7_TEGGR|nr:hypothetical protein KUTeg_007634 [Tegillarca granosa]